MARDDAGCCGGLPNQSYRQTGCLSVLIIIGVKENGSHLSASNTKNKKHFKH